MARRRFLGDLSNQISCPSFANADDGHVFFVAIPCLTALATCPISIRTHATCNSKVCAQKKEAECFVFCLFCVITTYKTIARTIETTEITEATHATIVAIVALLFAF